MSLVVIPVGPLAGDVVQYLDLLVLESGRGQLAGCPKHDCAWSSLALMSQMSLQKMGQMNWMKGQASSMKARLSVSLQVVPVPTKATSFKIQPSQDKQ